MILSKLKEIAETFLGKTVKDVVITVPAYFDDSQRQATKEAGHVAGLNILQILNEPTSAAIAYGLDTRNNITRETNVLIFDLGGGTFDVAIVNTGENSKVKVDAVDGDTHLGGQDFDNMIMDYFVEGFNRKHKTDVSGNLRALGPDTEGKTMLQEFFNGKELSHRIRADEAVAHGAALLAAKLRGEKSNKGDLMSVIIPRNTPIPVKEEIYYSAHDNQSVMSVIVYQGERSSVKKNNWLGQFHVAVPIGPAVKQKIKVVFNVDANAILSCSGEEMITGLKREIIISIDKHRLSKVEIEKMLKSTNLMTKSSRSKLKTIRKTSESLRYLVNKKKIGDALEDASQCLHGSKLADVNEYTM
nr:hypothetical protein [Tanacetum cinerariifolium]